LIRKLTRKQFLKAAAATGVAAVASGRRAWAARPIVIRFGIDLPLDHPTTVHVQALAEDIKTATNGEVTLAVFPNNQLGNDEHMLSNLRSGAMQVMGIGDNILAELVPSAAIDNLGFAFKDSTAAWAAMDGGVGALVRPDIEASGLHVMDKIWDMGFREITTSTKPITSPTDLRGVKIRVPPSEMNVSIFRDLGAAPVTMNSVELYTALQTKVVDGQETPLGVIETTRWYQVQKYCSMTNHMWVGYWMAFNADFWKTLSPNHQEIIGNAFDKAAIAQRIANSDLNASLEGKLTSQGLIFNKPDEAQFQNALRDAGYYKEWKDKFGPKLWSALEQYVGSSFG
jgi:tripartite ATP-independent transporter DctP family solute receptor